MPKNPQREVFAWHDDKIVEREGVHPFALAARALSIVQALDAMAVENDDSERWVAWGVAAAVGGLAEAGEWDAIGLLLAGLENLVPQEQRDKWPLADFTEPGRSRAA